MHDRDSTEPTHYLAAELYQRVRTDPSIFDFLQRGSLDGLWYWDVTQPENEWMSPEFKALFGYQDHEIPNTSRWWQDHIHPDDLTVALTNFEKHLQDPNHPYDQVVRYHHKSGNTVWVRCRGIAIRDENGKPVRMLGAHTDLTDLHLKAEQLSRANEMLERFAYLASHDLKQPLRTMISFASLTKREAGEDASPALLEYLGHINDGARKLAGLVESLLQMSRASGVGSLHRQRQSIAEPVSEAVAMLDTLRAERSVQITVEVGDLQAHIDATLFANAIRNLVLNALQAVPAPGGRVEIHAHTDGDAAVIHVDDNGPGVAEQDTSTVFSPFWKGSQSTGSGLGLASVKETIERHGGTVHVSRAPLGGARFELRLPV